MMMFIFGPPYYWKSKKNTMQYSKRIMKQKKEIVLYFTWILI